jgi:hypothetical protein
MRAASVFVWLGLIGPPAAWAAQLVAGYAAEEAECSGVFDGSRGVTVWTSVAAGVVALLSLVAAASLLRRARGRMHFMAFAGVLNGALFLALIIVTAIGATHFDPCRPG